MDGTNWKQGWQRDLDRAQKVTQFVINSREFDRIRYGFEEDAMHHPKCDDCWAPRGMFHLLGCDIESCPRCSGQAISCDCFHNEKPGEI